MNRTEHLTHLVLSNQMILTLSSAKIHLTDLINHYLLNKGHREISVQEEPLTICYSQDHLMRHLKILMQIPTAMSIVVFHQTQTQEHHKFQVVTLQLETIIWALPQLTRPQHISIKYTIWEMIEDNTKGTKANLWLILSTEKVCLETTIKVRQPKTWIMIWVTWNMPV